MTRGNPSSDRQVTDLRPPTKPTRCPTCDQPLKPEPTARPPHPLTMAGKGPR